MTADTEEDIKKCLDCKRPRCNNCLNRKRGRPIGRRGKAVIGVRGKETVEFPSIRAAADAVGVADCSICDAIKRKGRSGGYYWRYLDG